MTWISVKERIPEPRTRVAVYSQDCDFCGFGELRDESGYFYLDDGLRSKYITHWEPLSEVAKGLMNGWIGVEDRLPPSGSKMLFTDGKIVGACVDTVGGLYLMDQHGLPNLKRQVLDITHWQPLPEAPLSRSDELQRLCTVRTEQIARDAGWGAIRVHLDSRSSEEPKHQYAEC